jgi:hypothetical protein
MRRTTNLCSRKVSCQEILVLTAKVWVCSLTAFTLLQKSGASGQIPELVSQPPVVRSKIWCLQEMRIRGCMLTNNSLAHIP